jgi:hypothetical protein
MKAVTIDQLDIKDHVRWAQDQTAQDVVFLQESQIVALHPEILGMTTIYPSKLEELFELQKKNLPWATFSPPQQYQMFSRRFFSYRLFPNILWKEGEESEDEGNEEELLQNDLIQAVMGVKKLSSQSGSLFEKDKAAILNLLEAIKWINKLLLQINARKLQYQKG